MVIFLIFKKRTTSLNLPGFYFPGIYFLSRYLIVIFAFFFGIISGHYFISFILEVLFSGP